MGHRLPDTALPHHSAAPSERYHRQLRAVMDVAWAINSALGIARVYLDRFISEVRELLLPETERFGCVLHVDVRFDGVARFDAAKLKRVIFNLARNACQAVQPGGRFTWRVEGDRTRVVFECSDTGPGIPPEMEGRLFESFATHGKRDGTGLGLAMAKKVIDAHRGQLSCESRPGRGATFRIVLPG